MIHSSCPLRRACLLVLVFVPVAFAQSPAGYEEDAGTVIERICFGSCCKQDDPAPIWDAIAERKPDLFLFIGDNIYGDSEDMNVLRQKYAELGAMPGYKKLRTISEVIALWDDHDYGKNDAGADYKMRSESQQVFLSVFDEPKASPRRSREGVYLSRTFGPEGKRVQIILLDSRYFRSPLVKRADKEVPGEGLRGPYGENEADGATVLGEAQWAWLKEELQEPADLRIVASSIQVLAKEHHWEGWARFPNERQRLLDLIASTRANGVVFLSGDRHHAEVSRLSDSAVGYPLYDVTSSSLNRPRQKWVNERNSLREGSIFGGVNFGQIDIAWGDDPEVRLEIRGESGGLLVLTRVRLSELRPPRKAP